MRVVDAFCGTGGWSAGAVAAGCTPVLGIDCDETPMKHWASNCGPAGGHATCATIGADEAVPWPTAALDVHVHLSPPCTSLSQAMRPHASLQAVACYGAGGAAGCMGYPEYKCLSALCYLTGAVGSGEPCSP